MAKKLLFSFIGVFWMFLFGQDVAYGQCTSAPTNPSVTIALQGQTTLCSDETLSFDGSVSPTGTNPTFQWQESINGGNWTPIPNATQEDLVNYAPKTNSRIRLKVLFCAGTEFETPKESAASSTITVNPVKTGSVTISADKTNICPNGTVNFTAQPVNHGTGATYDWRVNGSSAGNNPTFSSNTLPDGAQVQLFMTSSVPCVEPFQSNIITIDHKPAAPQTTSIHSISSTTLSDPTSVCPNISGVNYNIPTVDRATSYEWTLPSGWSGSSTTNSITVTTGAVGDNKVISVRAVNECGPSADVSLNVNVGPGKPATPGAISDPGLICSGDSFTLEVPLDSAVSSYTWSVPTGWDITGGQGTNIINVTAGSFGQDGTVSVYSTNSCLDSDPSTKNFSINEPAPADPGNITGSDMVCPGSDMTYTINPVTYADQYVWYLDGSEVTGQTGTSVTVNSGATGQRTLKVIAVNECVDPADYTSLAGSAKTITVDDGTPAQATITQSESATSFCENQTNISFSVDNDPKIDVYSWQVPSGWSITSGEGTSSITVTAGPFGADGDITFTGSSNDCGSTTATYSVSVKDPKPVINSETISGPTDVCHNETGLTYSFLSIQYATSYVWVAPSDWTITSGQGTNTITVSTGMNDGTISVYAENECGQSGLVELPVSSVDAAPAQPDAITSSLWVPATSTEPGYNKAICPPADGITFSVTDAADADSYNWILPAGWEITAGENTSSITVRVTASAAYEPNESVSVEAVNICGNSTVQTYDNIVLSDYVLVDAGPDQTVCRTTDAIIIAGSVDFNGSKMKITPVSSGSGSFNGVPNGKVDIYEIKYVPSQADIDTLDQVIITVNTEAPVGACGPGSDEMIITFRDDPQVSISGDNTICAGDTSVINFSGSPNTTVSYTANEGAGQTIVLDASGVASLTTPALTATTTYELQSAVYNTDPTCFSAVSGSATVTVTPVPTASIAYDEVCSSETSLAVTLTGTDNYTGGTFTAPSGVSINSTTGEINPSLSTPGTYTVTYTIPAFGGCAEIPVTTDVTIREKIVINTQPVEVRTCEGGTAQFEVQASGEGLTYQWYKGTAAAGNEVAGGGTSSILSLSGLSASDAGDYLVVISGTSSCDAVTSTAATLSVDQNIVIQNPPVAQTTCEGGTASFTVDATSGGASLGTGFTYQWYKGTPGSGTPVSGATSATLDFSTADLSDSGDYYVEISGPSGYTCQPANSTAATLNVRKAPSVEISGTTSICSGTAADITFANGISNGIVTYTINNNNTAPQIFTLDANGAGVLNTGTLTATSGADTDYIYTLESVAYPDDPDCSAVVSGSATITVAPNPDVTLSFTGDQSEFCTADATTYTPSLQGTGTFSGGTFSATGMTIDANTGAFVPQNQAPGDYVINYTIPAYGGCPEEPISLPITIYKEVKITTQPYNVGICSTQDAQFSITATGDNLTYQWFKDGNPIPGAEGPVLDLPVATSDDAGQYFVRVSGTNACTPTEDSKVDSDVVTLNVDEDIVIIEPATDVSVCETGDASVDFRFVAHANGAPLKFTWVYADGTNVTVDGTKITSSLTTDPDYKGTGTEVYIGTLTINNIVEADENRYAVYIDGSDNNFSCPTATSNAFLLEVNPVPDAPVVETVEYCIGETADALTATGTNLKWYENAQDTIPSDIAPVPSTDVAGEFTYQVTQTPLYCESNRATIKVIVYDRPAPPALTPEESAISYCMGATATALTATPDAGATLIWYDSATSTTPLAAAPVPTTGAAGTLQYWVSQKSAEGCEGDRAVIDVTIDQLPNIVPPADTVICSGDSVDVTASDANVTDGSTTYSWNWEANAGAPETGSTVTLAPTGTTTYTITATNSKGCVNSEQFTISVDERPVGGTLEGPASVCTTDPSGTLTLTGSEGTIARWEYLSGSATDWTTIANTTDTYDFSSLNLSEDTRFRAVLTNGVCEEVYSAEHLVVIDPVPIAGGLLFKGTDRIFMMCEFPTSDYLVPLQTSGNYVGEIIAWQYRRNSATDWATIENTDGTNFTGTSLSGEQVEAASNNESTIFRVEVQSGACTPNVYSETATLSIIPSDIAPNPVTATPGEICFGDTVSLSSGTGYGGYGVFLGGAFDNSSIANHGWRVMRYPGNTEYTFESAADNTRPDRWMRTTPKEFSMADPDGSGTVKQLFDSSIGDEGNKGFAIVSGDNPSTLETPVFNLYATQDPVLTFDQAYNLTPGDTIKVQISLDGGNTYVEEPLFVLGGPAFSGNYESFGDGDPESRPLNKMSIDISKYAGLGNLRIRWLYDGSTGGIYTIDDIGIPQDPQNVQLIWYYDDDLDDPNNELDQIGDVNQTTVTYTPTKIGWNYFEVQTALVFDTNGDPCESAHNKSTIQVYVHDTYTSTATAEVGSCGASAIQLTGIIEGAVQGLITEFPVDSEATVAWEVINAPEDYVFSEAHFSTSVTDPNAVFDPGMDGSFTLRWAITKDPDSPCEPTNNDVTIDIVDCTTLDFDGVDDYVDLGTSYTGSYTVEAWIRPFDRAIEGSTGTTNSSQGTIFSGPNFEVNMSELVPHVVPGTRWYHIAITPDRKLYIDGILIEGVSLSDGHGLQGTYIGANNNSSGEMINHFSGWIEEVRFWNKGLTQNQIRFMMNQRLINNGAEMGEQIPMPVPEGLTYSDLAGYYRLISKDPDPANLVSFDTSLMPRFGETPDLAINSVPGRLHNMTTNQQNTAPLPYISAVDGQTWETDNTWIRPNVWDPPNSAGVTGDPINWNIAITNHNIDSGNKDITLLGLKSETSDKLITMANPSGPMDETNSGQMMRVTHYLLLNGNMDLIGESQLLQDEGSILAEESAGWLERDQQGKRLSFNYNYWSSPVSAQGGANNADYSVSQILLDGTNSKNPQTIKFDDRYHAADGTRTSPITISNYWIWKFLGEADVYEQWFHIGSTGTLATGEGYTMKGTDGTVGINDLQNYVFKGKPHNGDFTRQVSQNQNYLVGNPYPSAMDAKEFILDNMKNVSYDGESGRNTSNIFNGALYYWDHFSGSTHYLEQYIGGYATWTLAGGVEAISNDERINANDQHGTKEPGKYIPVAQGFFVNTVLDSAISAATGITVSGGPIQFKNRQRIYQREEGNSESIFHTQEKKDVKNATSQSSAKQASEDTRQKIWLKFDSPLGYHRQLLVTADPNTSSGFDLGYDAPLIEDNDEDMYWFFNNYEFVIQAVQDFKEDRELDLGMKVHEEGNVTISIDNLKNIPDDLDIFLKDSLLQVNHDLRKTAYRTTSDTGTYHNRFKVIFKDPTAVVIEEPEIPEEGEFEILYVNGSREILVKNPELLNIERIYLNNVLGQQLHVYYDIPAEKELRLPVKRFSSGVYIVKIHSEKGIRTKKVILE